MRIPSIITRKKKLKASTARRSRLGLPDEMDYEEMGEPNMKLSRALLIVLLLHVVAVAGIFAFNTIKTRESFSPATADNVVSATPNASPAAVADSSPNEVAKSETNAAPATHAAAPNDSGVKDSGRVYVVVRGDNPVRIARHFKVSEADLLALNQITDSRKLQINQKLHIPERTTTKRPND
jgi:LysM repeat protein